MQSDSKMPRAQRVKLTVFLVLFLAVLGLSFPVFNVFSKQLSKDNHENRLLTTLPMVFEKPLGQWPSGLDEFLADNSPFRGQLISINGQLNYRLFRATDSNQVLIGKQDWLFYKDGPVPGDPVANYQGTQRLTEEQLAVIAQGLQAFADACEAGGTKLVFSIAPSKDVVYPEYMPENYPRISQDSMADQLAAYLAANTTVAVGYDKAAIRQAKSLMRIYQNGDTHWNNAGALLVLDQALSAAGWPVQPFEDYRFEEIPGATPDLVNLAALYDLIPPDTDYRVLDYPFADGEGAVAVCGDSFSHYYMPYLQQRFAAASRTDLVSLDVAALSGSGADLVILQATERNFFQLAALLEAQT